MTDREPIEPRAVRVLQSPGVMTTEVPGRVEPLRGPDAPVREPEGPATSRPPVQDPAPTAPPDPEPASPPPAVDPPRPGDPSRERLS
jgi:hypothetical protein